MGLVQLLINNPVLFLMIAIPLLYSIIAHEVAHGASALMFGDDTAKENGRLTFNPIPHIDPLGLVMLLFVGFGWAKPVPVNYDQLNNSRLAQIVVALSGCFVNFIIAFVSLSLLQFEQIRSFPYAYEMFAIVARINIILCVLNLIPIPPLDGSRVLTAFLPQQQQLVLAQMEIYGFFVLLLLLVTGVLTPVIQSMQQFLLKIIALIFSLFR